MVTYAEIVNLFACPKCFEPTGTACHDLAMTSRVRRLVTPHRERLRLASNSHPQGAPMPRNTKYNRWKSSHPKTLPAGFTAVTVLLTAKEAEFFRDRAILMSDGTYSAAIRDRMGLSETPRGLMKAVEDMVSEEEKGSE